MRFFEILPEDLLEGQPRRDTDSDVVSWLEAAYARPDANDLYLHGSNQTFDQFKQPKLEHGHLIFFSKLSDGNVSRPLQAEYYGHTLYLAKLQHRRPFNPYRDPKAKAILSDTLQADIKGVVSKQWDYDEKIKWGRLDYQDLYLVVPPAVQAGCNFFTVYEVSMRGNSYAVTDPSMIEVVARYPGDLQEAVQVEDPDEEDRRYDERRAREAKIVQLITVAFRRIGLDIAEDGVTYYEDSGRDAQVTLDDSEVDLTLLAKLATTGLATGYKIGTVTRNGYGELMVGFSVSPELDHVVQGR